ncbi:MAG: 4'-phosphopantetheinyl transferase superfamily protein [Shewanella sp.]|nr:4'-phosphopantetheinyl transferase superfamily protein [Shewanella sp.]
MSPLALYFVPFTVLSKSESEKLRCIISDDEIKRVERYIGEKQQQQSLLVRAGLRLLLSNYAKEHSIDDIAPQEWVFTKGEYGKPRLSDELFKQTKIEFNISHSGEWLLVGIIHHTQPISEIDPEFCFGVDIERERKNTNIHAILNRYFAQSEIDDLLALPSEVLQRERFFDLWACKESYIKATGKGLSTPLDSFAFNFSQTNTITTLPLLNSESLTLKSCLIKKHQQWSFNFGRLDSEYRYAISICNTSHNKRIFPFTNMKANFPVDFNLLHRHL